MAVHIINGSESGDQFNVTGPLPGDSLIYNGLGGNDVFVVNEGVARTSIYGTNGAGDFADQQLDFINLLGSAHLNSIVGIDVLSFLSPASATTLSYNANSSFGVSQVNGSTFGADTIHFSSAPEQVDLDLSKTVFANWGRANQTILVEMNSDATRINDDRFVGSAAGERVTAGVGRDLLYGNAGNDYLDGGEGIDVLDGGDGNDTLIGGDDRGRDGPNILKGGKGNDVYKFKEKVDIIIDSGGLDSRVVSKTTTLSSSDRLFEGLAADETLKASKTVNLKGTAKANVLLGHSGKNTLDGLAGNDLLEGRGGNDKLLGGAGNDRLSGGLGSDVLEGDAGRDAFVFDSVLGSGIDKIAGFSVKDDTIVLDKFVFTALGAGKLPFSYFVTGTAAKDADDRIIYNKTTGALSYDADGIGAAAAAIKFATLDKNLKLAAADFLIV
ncbi:hypothetical protein ILT44_14750 [Microvirga sp. BT689]|uniref:calcium-binding protein n=1 Tax=Microvirga arvi TaxID=2778731 RepID=UPI00194EFD64|nr:calcium-binding protein [Microvirga arvi]MBM6581453.1 hypothetical protein [Microvirga arvi]